MHTSRAQRDRLDRHRAVEIGDEPPLRVDGETTASQGSLNLRWLAGTILTGVAGLGLMGGAIATAMNGEARLAELPGIAQLPQNRGLLAERSSNAARKGDRMIIQRQVDENKQTFKVTTTTRIGDREVVRTRPVTRVSASFSAGAVQTASIKIPPFNAMSIFIDTDGGKAQADPGPAPDGDISYVVRNLAELRVAPDDGVEVSMSDVLARVRETADLAAVHGSTAQTFASGRVGTALALASPEAALQRPGGFAPLVTSPGTNMTVLSKQAASGEGTPDTAAPAENRPAGAAPARPAAAPESGEKVITVQAGDRLEEILLKNGATREEARAIAAAFGGQQGYGTVGLKSGQKVKILMAATDQKAKREQPVRITVENGEEVQVVAISDTGGYVAVGDGSAAEEGDEEESEDTGGVRLYEALYATAVQKGVPAPVVSEMVRVLGYDADFQRRISDGDGFEVLYASDEDGKTDSKPEVLFAALVTGGETKRYFRFQPAPDQPADYYDENGRSARKFLMRKPMNAGIFRSGFGGRRHPILGYTRMHTGVDWSAPRGTPIYASGNGVVEKAEWDGGYGRYVRIRHANGYETGYGHMSAFARGIEAGVRVRQGQLIGYVGSTGLSTGSHLHYEVIVNGRFLDPMRIRVPRGNELDGDRLVAFKAERARIEGMLGRSTMTAQTGG